MGKIIIYLGDLAHNYISKGPFVFPLNIGAVASYAKSLFGDDVEIKLFKFPSDLIDEIKQQKPDIVGLSNYTWNLDLNMNIINLCKSISKEIITVFGGPDYPVDEKDALEYMKQRNNLDFYVLYQGELGFANIVKKYLELQDLEKMKTSAIEDCCYYDDNKLVVGEKKYFKDLSVVPSPYLTGLMDPFFDENFIPIIETNKGCPYSCKFCAWGKSVQKKMVQYPLDRVKKEIDYIAERVKNTNVLLIGDSNFGIFERDIEIAEYLKNIKEKTDYPRHISFAFAKCFPERKLKIMELLKDITSVTASFQSLDPTVLKLINRNNEANEFFLKNKDAIPENVLSHSELILSLPGETKKSHEDAIRTLFNSNIGSIICYNLIMIGGSELNTTEERKKHGVKTKFRLLDNGFGKYDGMTSMEIHEIVLETNTMTEDETLYFRPIHWLMQFMWNYRYYTELLNFFKSKGINPLDYMIEILNSKDTAPEPVKKVIEDFYRFAKDEWFDSKEELVDHYSKDENWKQLQKGSFGKLNYQYSIRILLECKKEFDTYIHQVALDMFTKQDKLNKENTEMLEDLSKFTQQQYLDFTKGLDSCEDNHQDFRYNILQWKKDNYAKPLKDYKKDINYHFFLSKDHLSALKKVYEQYKQEDMNLTLRKMIEYMRITDLFFEVKEDDIKKETIEKKELNQIIVDQNSSIKKTMKAIDHAETKTAVIVDKNNKLCGLVTDGDIRRGILRGINIHERISQIMNKDPICASVKSSTEEILNILKNKKITNLPLVDENKVVKDFVLLTEGKEMSFFGKDTHIRKHIDRVLVIGGAGFIGSILTRKLLAKGYKVNILDKFIYGKESLEQIRSNPDLKVIEGDTRHIEDITKAIIDVDAVVHLAELVGDPACALSPSTTQEINYFATKIIAEVCKHFQINRLVYASSCSVYGASEGTKLLTEESPLIPVSLYAKMKIASEKALNEMQDTNFRPTILRFATVFGYSHRPRFDLVVNTLTAKAVKDGKITIFGGDQWRPNVHVADVADSIISVLESHIETVGGEVFNIGSEENNHTINETGELVKQAIPSASLVIEEKEIDKRDYKVDFSKSKKILKTEMKHRVIDGINELKKAFEDNKIGDYTDKKYSNIKFLEENGLLEKQGPTK